MFWPISQITNGRRKTIWINAIKIHKNKKKIKWIFCLTMMQLIKTQNMYTPCCWGVAWNILTIPCREVTPLTQRRRDLHMTQNCIRQWGSSSENLGYMEYPFIAIITMFSLNRNVTVWVSSMDKCVLWIKCIWFKVICIRWDLVPKIFFNR